LAVRVATAAVANRLSSRERKNFSTSAPLVLGYEPDLLADRPHGLVEVVS